MASLNTTINRKRRLTTRVADVFGRVESFRLSHARFLELWAELRDSEDYKRAPFWVHEYLSGYVDGLMSRIWSLVVFSYAIDGKRLTLDSAEYRAVDPKEVCDKWLDTGAYVWREDPARFWTTPKQQ